MRQSVLTAVRSNESALMYASEDLCDDESFLWECLNATTEHPSAIRPGSFIANLCSRRIREELKKDDRYFERFEPMYDVKPGK